jgi:hypothetical protein
VLIPIPALLALLVAAAPPGAGPPPAVESPEPLEAAPIAAGDARRRAWLASTSREKQLKQLALTPRAHWVAMANAALPNLGTYRTRMFKQERSQGVLPKGDELALTIRPAPLAIRIEYVQGEAEGRKVLYRSDLRPESIRVHERGALSIMGAFWIEKDGKLAHDGTRYPVTELGLGPLVGHIADDTVKLAQHPEIATVPEGFDAEGLYCTLTVSPPEAQLFAPSMRVCWDLALGLPTKVDLDDAQGPRERHRYRNIEPQLVDLPPETFDPSKL